MGFTSPTPIQQQAIPLLLEGRDIVASAQTGTGKTAAFVVPILQKLLKSPNTGLQCLILSPTRELAQQIDEQIFAIGYYSDIPSVTIYGGGDWGEQQKALERGVRIIVATPGRLLDLIKVRNIDFSKIEILVLDEADRMLDMGFIPDVRTIINRVPKQRQTLFFSATIHDKLKPLLDEFLTKPERISIAPNKAAKGVNQWLYFVDMELKAELIRFLMMDDRFPSSIIFTSTKRGADELARELRRKRLAVESIHGDRTQQEREVALAAFKAGKTRILVATDVLARGIDIEEVSLVINYDVPRELEDYIHRIGRTARADAKGDAITLVSYHDKRYLDPIRKAMGDQLVVLDVPQDLNPNRRPQRDDKAPPRERFESRSNQKAPIAEKPVVEKTVTATESTEKNEETASEAQPAPRRSRRQPAKKKTEKPATDDSAVAVDAQENTELESEKVVKPRSRRAPRKAKPVDDTSDTTKQKAPKESSASSKSDDEAKPDSRVESSDEGEAPVKRRRRRGGRNRRRRPDDTRTDANSADGDSKPETPVQSRGPAPERQQGNRPDSRRDDRRQNDDTTRHEPRPAPRTDNSDRQPKNERTDQRRPQPPRSDSRGPQRDDRQNRGQGQGQGRGRSDDRNRGPRYPSNRNERPSNLGVTHKLPVTNDLSSMSTSLKGNASKSKPSAAPEKKGVFGFIKKLFGKDDE